MTAYSYQYVIVECEYKNCLNTVEIKKTVDPEVARREARAHWGFERVGNQDFCMDHVSMAKKNLEKVRANGR